MKTSNSNPPATPQEPQNLRELLALKLEPFIEAAYSLLLGRPVDEEGRHHYMERLRAGAPKIVVLRELQESAEGQQISRTLPGLPTLPGRRWWSGLPLLRRLARGHVQDHLLGLTLAVEQAHADQATQLADLSARLGALQVDTARRLAQLEHDIVLRAGGFYARDNWEAMRSVLSLRADRFIQEAFRVALHRPPAAHELEHFRHLQEVGIGQHTLLASLLASPEARSLSGNPAEECAAVQPPGAPRTRLDLIERPPLLPLTSTAALPEPWASELANVSFLSDGHPLVSVIIPVYGKADYTLRCLASIAKHRPRCSFEVIVVDDKSPDNSVELLQQVHGLQLLTNETNLGFVRNCNRGASEARGRYLCFLNNDTEVKPDWLDELVGTYDMFPDAGLIGSKLVFPDGTLQEAGGIMWKDGSAWNYGRGQDPARSIFNYARETDYCSGASILIEAALFERLGRFDERFAPAYCEDSSLAFAVRAAGKQVIYQPKSEVIHYEGVSHGTSTSSGIKAYQVINQGKFLDLWRETLEREHFPNAEHVPLARERSVRKRMVLVIDHYVPQPDRDAGSRTMWQFLQLLRDQGTSVKFWPDNLWRDPAYTPALERAGIEVIYGSEYGDKFENWIAEHGRYLDMVLLSRPHISGKFIDALRRHTRARLVYYGHDIHHLRLRRQLAIRYDGDTDEAMAIVEHQEKGIWPRVDVVLYPSADETAFVRDWLRERRSATIAATIPAYAFTDLPEAPWSNLAQRKDVLFVAGFGHPPNSGAARWFVSEVLPRLVQAKPGLNLHLVGSNPTDEVKSLQSANVAVTGYVDDATLSRYYLEARVSVAPLLYGGGVKGKVVESMRFGLPCVTSPAGVQGLGGTSEFLAVAADPKKFADEVLLLLEDDDLWAARSAASQAYVRQHYSRQAIWDVLSQSFVSSPFSSMQERLDHVCA